MKGKKEEVRKENDEGDMPQDQESFFFCSIKYYPFNQRKLC